MRSHLFYHSSPVGNLVSIASAGLLNSLDRTSNGAVFLSDLPPPERKGVDVWLVEVSGLQLHQDHTGQPDRGAWFMHFGAIAAERLVLEKIRLSIMATGLAYHDDPLFRVVHLKSGEESALYRREEAERIVRLAQTGELLGSFMAGVSA
ncbi:hypothetical protein [Ralstonia pseudosolanacearum]|uniref:hypothetical protein n=1 Tax=Ralstonia pseudosolanacearum TaxID=1310165 RepID=UPI003CEBDBA8